MSAADFDVEVKLTSELTARERARFCWLFEDVFQRQFPEDLFLRKYRDAYMGDSLHCLAIRDEIAGAFSAVLFRYSFFGRECLFAIAIDLMLETRFRPNVALMRRTSEALYSRLAASGVAFVFSCVREEMMRFHEVIGRWRRIGRVRYQAAPIRGPHVPGLGACLRMLVRASNGIGGAGVSDAAAPAIEKVNDLPFRAYRYSFFPTEYRTVRVAEGEAVYTGKMFWDLPGAPKGIALSLLVDVWPQRLDVFDAVVQHIARTDRDVDYLIYPGYLAFQPRRMWRVPERLEPTRYFLGGRILRPDLIDERVYDIGNWNINLSNTDLV
jgi:hypothetical protein